MPTTSYGPVWKCIYCGSDDRAGLTKEHIVPRGLGGDRVLPKASCETCRKETAKLENFFLRSTIGKARIIHDLPTAHPHERPDRLPLTLHMPDGSEKDILIPVNEYPAALALPVPPPPRILRGLPDDEPPNIDGRLWQYLPSNEARDRLFLKYGPCSVDAGAFEIVNLSRVIAKMAFGFVVGELGIDNIFPLAQNLILGKTSRYNFLVGGAKLQDEGQFDGTMNMVYYTHHTGLIRVDVRIFPFLGGPTYQVVVGAKKR